MKIAIDIHGVITKVPQFFSLLTKYFIDNGHEIHLLTGSRINEKLLERIKTLEIKYTHLFSIVDYHIEQGTEIFWEDENNPWMDEETWNKTKADYCVKNNIDLCIDDDERYVKYFTSPLILFKTKLPSYDGFVKDHRLDPRKKELIYRKEILDDLGELKTVLDVFIFSDTLDGDISWYLGFDNFAEVDDNVVLDIVKKYYPKSYLYYDKLNSKTIKIII